MSSMPKIITPCGFLKMPGNTFENWNSFHNKTIGNYAFKKLKKNVFSSNRLLRFRVYMLWKILKIPSSSLTKTSTARAASPATCLSFISGLVSKLSPQMSECSVQLHKEVDYSVEHKAQAGPKNSSSTSSHSLVWWPLHCQSI